MPLGRMDWSCSDFWLAVEAGKNRSSTTTSPCTPYPLPSELQGDKVGKDYLLQNLHRDMRTGISNGQALSTLEKARFLAGEDMQNRLCEPLRQKDPIGHSSCEIGARSNRGPQYHLSKLLKWVSHCGKQVSPISHEWSFHSGLALLTRAFFQQSFQFFSCFSLFMAAKIEAFSS